MIPVIGILSTQLKDNDGIAKMQVNEEYCRAVTAAGGLPVLLPCTSDVTKQTISEWAELINGLVIPGGHDVAPMFYGQSPVKEVTYTNRIEDAIELNFARLAFEKNIPILGICRGMQLLNVAFGGTLWQDIPSQVPNTICHRQSVAIRDEMFHAINLKDNSILAKVMGQNRQECNTHHHQAVAKMAVGFNVAAEAPDGIIEAMEHQNGNIVAVQWHPEVHASAYEAHANIFKWLVDKATK